MAISPADIEKKTFSTALRGYDLDEVDDFLDEMVAGVRELEEQLTAARQRVAELEGDPEAVAAAAAVAAQAPVPGPDESAVGRALVAAQQAADRILDDARGEAEKIMADARTEADTFAKERDAKKAEVDAEMSQMTELVAGVRTKLAVLATTVADKLDEMDAAVAGAGGASIEPDTGTAVSEQSMVEEASEDVGTEEAGHLIVDDGNLEDQVDGDQDSVDQDVELGDGSDDEAGLEVDMEAVDTDEDESAGSAEIEGVDSEENREI